MIENLSMQKRMLIAVTLSVMFFVAYSYFFPPQTYINEANSTNSTKQTSLQKTAPVTKTETIQSAKKPTNLAPLVKIKGPFFDAHIDNLGRISKFYLNETKYRRDDGSKIELVTNEPYALEVRFSNPDLNEIAFVSHYKADKTELDLNNGEDEVTLTQNLGEFVLTKKIKFYQNGKYDVSVNINKPTQYFITPGFRPNEAIDGYTVHGVLIKQNDGSLENIEDGDAKESKIYNAATIAAASDRYYTTFFYNKNGFDVVVSPDNSANGIVFIQSTSSANFSAFIGPKSHDLLKSIDSSLTDVIEYGWFTFLSKPLFSFLNLLYGFFGNWGWSIVAMTLVIRIILFPLTFKSMVSMNKLKDLAPKMKEIQAKYKDDKQKMQMQIMDLYRKTGANPMGGCLPILLQIPIFFAIYRVLLNAIELKGAEWILWINDLAIKDPYFILPILMGLTMFIQQRITPTNFTDPMQEKIMKFLPLIFVVFFITFPAGLTLYWCVNNICSLIQQMVVNKIFKNNKNKEIAEAKV